MKVSLLIPVYGVEEYIGRCARSLFGQTYGDIEYIFVDDATPDRSMEVLGEVMEEHPARKEQVRIITHKQNAGIAAVRNTLLHNATGDWIMWVDSDDWLDPRAVELLVERAVETKADLVVFDYYEVRRERKYLRTDRVAQNKNDYVRDILNRRVSVSVWTKFARRYMYTDNDIRFLPGHDYGEDFLVAAELAYFSVKTVKLDVPLYYYLYRQTSLANNLTPRKADDLVAVSDDLEKFFASVPDAEIYKPMINEMKVINKVAILQAGNRQTWEYALNLYPESNPGSVPLSFSRRVILWLHRHRMWGTMKLYQRLAFFLRRLRSGKAS